MEVKSRKQKSRNEGAREGSKKVSRSHVVERGAGQLRAQLSFLKKTKKVKKRKMQEWGWRTSVPKNYTCNKKKINRSQDLFLFTSKTSFQSPTLLFMRYTNESRRYLPPRLETMKLMVIVVWDGI